MELLSDSASGVSGPANCARRTCCGAIMLKPHTPHTINTATMAHR